MQLLIASLLQVLKVCIFGILAITLDALIRRTFLLELDPTTCATKRAAEGGIMRSGVDVQRRN